MTNDEASAQAAEASLSIAMTTMVPSGIAVACRYIRSADEALLLPDEAASIPARQPSTRRASGAARYAARQLFHAYGMPAPAIVRAASGEPLWPNGFHGSLAHDEAMAIATITDQPGIAALGIDIEPADALPSDIATLVRLPADDTDRIDAGLADRLLFSAKEAVYKASFSLDREILGYEHIVVDFPNGRGLTVHGRQARLYWCVAPRIVVLAVV